MLVLVTPIKEVTSRTKPDETEVGTQLHEVLLQFFQLFPNLKKNDFFGGTSYAGKYVPAIAYTIYKHNRQTKTKINLKGLVVGNGLNDPEHQIGYGDYLYQIGLVDTNGRRKFKEREKQYIAYIKSERWKQAVEARTGLVVANSLFSNLTGSENIHNFLQQFNYLPKLYAAIEFLKTATARCSLHVGNMNYIPSSDKVYNNLKEDVPKAVAPWISELLNNYKFLFYAGQTDILDSYPLIINFLRNLEFNGSESYKTAVRHKWYVDGELAGYVKTSKNLIEMLVLNASHGVHLDQPKWTLDLMTRFRHSLPFY